MLLNVLASASLAECVSRDACQLLGGENVTVFEVWW